MHKLAVAPSDPCVLYSCAGDGALRRVDLRAPGRTSNCVLRVPPRSTSAGLAASTGSSMHALHSLGLEPMGRPHVLLGGCEGSARIYDLRMAGGAEGGGGSSSSPSGGEGGSGASGARALVQRCVPEHLRTSPKTITSVAYSYDGKRLLAR